MNEIKPLPAIDAHSRWGRACFSSCLSVLLVGFALLVPGLAAGGELEIEDAWVRLPPPGANTAGYMTLVNRGDTPIRVTGVVSDTVERVELHESLVADGVARMRPVEIIEVPAGGRVTLAPRGLHLMLIRPGPLAEGGTVSLELEIDGQENQTVKLPVRREEAQP